MKLISRVSVGMLVANCLGVYGWSIPGPVTEQELAVAAENLGSSRDLRVEDIRVLFDAGLRAIPHLVAKFGDQTEFHGLCGRAILSSEASDYSLDDPYNLSRVLYGAPTISVREVSLYLVVAIMREDLYFAEVCKPVVGPSPRIKADPLGDALDNIRSTYEKSVADRTALNRESIESVLKLHAVTFSASIPRRK